MVGKVQVELGRTGREIAVEGERATSLMRTTLE